jgi:hypothetical protein
VGWKEGIENCEVAGWDVEEEGSWGLVEEEDLGGLREWVLGRDLGGRVVGSSEGLDRFPAEGGIVIDE